MAWLFNNEWWHNAGETGKDIGGNSTSTFPLMNAPRVLPSDLTGHCTVLTQPTAHDQERSMMSLASLMTVYPLVLGH